MARANLCFLHNVERNRSPTAAVDFIPWLTRYMQDDPTLRRPIWRSTKRPRPPPISSIDGTLPPETSAALIRKVLDQHGALA
ncbi:MAG TPA: hypothetical protein VMV19_09645 [Xanthobacteraceae bacterium]|nr:hypothetical protein [Xanthobacteraceae bacterium]